MVLALYTIRGMVAYFCNPYIRRWTPKLLRRLDDVGSRNYLTSVKQVGLLQ